MGRVPVAAVLFVVLFLLAGCSGGSQASDGSSSSSSASTSSSGAGIGASTKTNATHGPSFDLLQCSNRGGTFDIARSSVAPLLPPGFELLADSSPTAPPDNVFLYVISMACESFKVNETVGGFVNLAYAELPVKPSALQAVVGLDDCTMPLFFGSTDVHLGNVLRDYGLGAAGSANLQETAAEGAPGGRVASYTVGPAQLQFIIGESVSGNLAVSNNDFVVYGVHEGKVLSRLRGSVDGSPQGNTALLAVQASGASGLEGFHDAQVGFALSPFNLHFKPLPVPAT